MKTKTFYHTHGVTSLFLFFFLLFSYSYILAQGSEGKPFINNYSYKEYNAGPVNWWAEEDNRGIMYFANGQGVLEYDGENWTIVKNSVAARSLAKDASGKMHVGCEGDIGYLEPDEHGLMTYYSLKDKIPEEHKYITTVWETDFFEGAIYYRTSDKLYKWNGETMKVITSEDAFHVGKIVNDKYYLRIWNRGLCVMEADTFRVVPGGEKFKDDRIYTILPYDEDRILLGSRINGLFLYDGNNFSPFKTEADPYIKGQLYLPGIALGDGRFVLNTFSGGAYVIDKKGKLLQSITQENGLQDNSVDYVFMDSRGILWLCLFNGISSINLNSQFTYFDQSTGLPSNVVFTFHKKDGYIYAGTNNGVYYKKEEDVQFKYMEGSNGQIANFVEHRGKLYNGSGGMGLIEITGSTFKYVRKDNNYDLRVNFLFKSKIDEDRLFITTQKGLISFYYDEDKKTYLEESRTEKVHPGFGGFEEDKEGALWSFGNKEGTIDLLIPKIIDGRLDLDNSEIMVYDSTNGLPDETVSFWKINEEIHANDFQNKVSYTFNPETKMFVKEALDYEDNMNYENQIWAPPVKDNEGNTWFNAGGGVTIGKKTSEGVSQYLSDPFLEIRSTPIWNIYVDEKKENGDQVAWFQGPDGIIRYEGNLEKPFLPSMKTNIRKVALGEDSLIYSGGVDLPSQLAIDNKNNTVELSYASPFYIGEDEMLYQTKLEGYDVKWTKWTEESRKKYINLPPGDYSFKVKSKNLYGVESEETSVQFKISPPWYSTWWAYLLFALGGIALVYGIVKSRTRLLRERQKELEAAVAQRTAEVELRAEELATVNKVSQVLTEKLELNELINLVGAQLKKLFKSNIAYLAILDEKTNIINFPYQDGDSMAPMKYGDGLTSQIIRTGESLLINKGIDREYKELGLKKIGKSAASYLGVPIPVEDKIIGVISVQSTESENRFNDSDKRLLSTIARNVGIALHNAELYEEAKAAKAQAEDANEAKSAFLSTVSHELRTPLTSVLGFAKIIRKRLEERVFPAVTVDDQKIKKTMKQISENLNVVVSEGERLTNLINDVLDLAKIESGRMEWNLKPIFIQDIINRAISSTTSLFDQKSLALEKLFPSDLPLVSGDQDKLIQVVINLLSNSVKFTDKGKISVDAYKDDGQIIIEIQDTGIGIAEADKHKVFERFRQAGDTLTDKPKGTGLGLPICREIIEKHGGIIWMKSELGVGSTFFFSIPILGDSTSGHTIQLDRIVNSLKKQISHSVLSKADNVSSILVVDDDTPIRSLLNQELSDAGYKVSEAADGKAALDMVRVNKPDLIILDVMMPEINGFDVAAVLKNDPDTMDIPIIILSIVEDKERGLKIGVDRYLTKPINTEELFQAVDVLLEQGVSKKSVLVLDEDMSTVNTLSDVLQKRGYKVLDVNGKDLVKTAVESKPDIIMLSSVYNGNKELLKSLKFEKGMENVLFFVYD